MFVASSLNFGFAVATAAAVAAIFILTYDNNML